MTRSLPARGCCTALLVLVLCTPALAAESGKSYTQMPTVEAAVSQSSDAGAHQAEKQLQQGPTAQWIWHPDASARCYLRKEFTADAEKGQLIATCDNRMEIYLNGQPLVMSEAWQSPVRREVPLRKGKNVVLVEAVNTDGPAGFVLKLVMPKSDGTARYLVSDHSWQAALNRDAQAWMAAKQLAPAGSSPWGDVLAVSATADAAALQQFTVLPGFQVEQLFTVPRAELGSWVSMTFDDRGRIIVSDQGDKGLCRVTPAPIGSGQPTKVERLSAKITSAQGLLYAFDSLYVVVNGPGSGLYRLRDTTGDDQFDEVEKLQPLKGGGEHGPHAVRLSPDGKSLYVICGNHTHPVEFDTSRPPSNWSEDLLLPRQWDARGHATGKLAPGGWIARTDPDGKSWEMVSIGYRNAYDMAFNADGELFAYDADMEWDLGMPWYRPTRVVHATSGSEFGWRSGTGKWPAYYVDSLPPLLDLGPGSPVGVTFGAGAKFPAKYQRALYLLDWTFGTIYALHLTPDGASYAAEKEEFLSRAALPLTDAEIGPDGALYFTVGGRNTQSALYRVTYVGSESTAPAKLRNTAGGELRALRRQIESYHRPAENQAEAVNFVWPHLSHADRFIRFAARVALEHQAPRHWQTRALAEPNPQAAIQALVALARQGDQKLRDDALAALERINYEKLSEPLQLDLLRAYQLVFIRLGEPDQEMAARLAQKFDAHYPSPSDPHNRELCQLLVYLNSPTVIDETLALLRQPRQVAGKEDRALIARNDRFGSTIAQMMRNRPHAEKIHLAFCLRNLRYGWTLEQRKEYFAFLDAERTKSGGASYQGFLDNIRKSALENASESQRQAIASAAPAAAPPMEELPKPIGPGHKWTMEEVVQLAQSGLRGRNFERGRRAFAAAQCISCHRFDGQGGATGPDLTNLAGRFNLRDLTESIIDPSKTVSDQYQASVVITLDGKVYNGRLLNETDQSVTLLIDPVDVTKTVEIPRDNLDVIEPSKTSLMPQDLLTPLNKDEVLDLLAYLLSRGNPGDRVFAE